MPYFFNVLESCVLIFIQEKDEELCRENTRILCKRHGLDLDLIDVYYNMSYGATVGASAAKSNLINSIKKIIFTPVLNKSNVHCDFSKWFIDYLKNANEFRLFICCCWYLVLIHISGPATVHGARY